MTSALNDEIARTKLNTAGIKCAPSNNVIIEISRVHDCCPITEATKVAISVFYSYLDGTHGEADGLYKCK
jgi:hypothetical protein